MSTSTQVRRKIEVSFANFLKSVLDDPALVGRDGEKKVYPTKGGPQLEMPFIVIQSPSKQNSSAGALDYDEIAHFDAIMKIVLVTDCDDEFMGPTSDWHDNMLRQIDDALNTRRKACPINEGNLWLAGFYQDGDESATEDGRYGDVLTYQVFGQG